MWSTYYIFLIVLLVEFLPKVLLWAELQKQKQENFLINLANGSRRLTN